MAKSFTLDWDFPEDKEKYKQLLINIYEADKLCKENDTKENAAKWLLANKEAKEHFDRTCKLVYT